MSRPNKPHWHEAGGCWRCKIGGKPVYFRPGVLEGFDEPIARDERPLVMIATVYGHIQRAYSARRAAELAQRRGGNEAGNGK